MKTFNNCLELGKIYEKESIKYLDYDSYEYSEGKCKEWDIKINKDKEIIYYEVKAELGCFKYNNICIEYMCSGKASGIEATIAQYWIHYAIKDNNKKLYDVFLIPTIILKKMINEKKYNRIVQCGDNNNASCYLFKMNLFNDYKIC